MFMKPHQLNRNVRSAPRAAANPLTNHLASAGSPAGLMRIAMTKNAIPPVVRPMTNRITAAMNTSPDAIPKIMFDTDVMNEKKAVTITSANAIGAAISFKMNLIAPAIPSQYSVFLYSVL